MGNPSVSILMTSYNRELYIGEAIQSVLSSTFEDFELIIVDDCSVDQTVQIARAYEALDARVKVHINEMNLGDYPNRNRAAALARGKYIKYVDSDDKIYVHSIRVMYEIMEQHPEAVLGLSARPVDNNRVPLPRVLTPEESYHEHFFLDGFLENGPLAAIIRRDAFFEVGGFSGKRMIGDTELWLKLARRYPVVRMPLNLVFWRQHAEQEFKKGFEFYLIDSLIMYRDVLRSLDTPLDTKMAVLIFRKKKYDSYHRLFRYLLKSKELSHSVRLFLRLKDIDYAE